MKKSTNKGENEIADDIIKKLDKIIEQSKLENHALKKLLKALQKMQNDNLKQ